MEEKRESVCIVYSDALTIEGRETREVSVYP
jgi:hypothetical protein